jgi:hypothetical protein
MRRYTAALTCVRKTMEIQFGKELIQQVSIEVTLKATCFQSDGYEQNQSVNGPCRSKSYTYST